MHYHGLLGRPCSRSGRGTVILCAQMFESVRLLFNSRTPDAPAGLANSSGRLGAS
jgi:choline dehydrogenase-like flavoprotein